MKHINKLAFAVFLFSVVISLSLLPIEQKARANYSLEALRNIHAPLFLPPVDSSQYFPTQVDCEGCHGFDPDGFALVDNAGNDVNMHDDWKTSMMANSAKDPFWRAKVSHEVLINPSHSAELQDKCTSCHAPMGHYTAKYRGHDHYLIADMLNDTVGLDGVSCGACHQISPENLGKQFSGLITYDTNRVQYGPYEAPFAPPMTNFVGFEPLEGKHINDAGVCANCHTLITESVDLEGNFTGTTFVEQATYHEWLNSQYNEDTVSCQACHMKRIQDSVIISDNYLFLQKRFPYGLHDLVGANTFMIQLMKDNKEALGIEASDDDFFETLFKTYDLLQLNSLDLDLELVETTSDSAFFKVTLLNKAGHKFPSGYPSRRAFIEFTVTTEAGDTLFKSGVLNSNYEVEGHDPHFEPHYQMINNPDQVQIYEIVNGDINGNFTTVLERAYVPLKDNRLTPLGFSTEHEVYDTTLIVGNAETDPDFNRNESGEQGTGADIVYYHVPLQSYSGLLDIRAKVWYQSLPPKWMAEMFGETTPEIEIFREMYDQADKSAVLIDVANINDLLIESTAVQEVSPITLGLSPNPSSDGWVYLSSPDEIQQIKIFNIQGQLLKTINSPASRFELPENQGIYIIEVKTRSEAITKTVKMLRL